MTSITYPFNDYPAVVAKRRGPELVAGLAEITLSDGLSVIDDKSGIWQIPLQRRLRWTIDSLSISLKNPDEEDLRRFLRGRHSCRIERRLYASFFAERAPTRPNLWQEIVDSGQEAVA